MEPLPGSVDLRCNSDFVVTEEREILLGETKGALLRKIALPCAKGRISIPNTISQIPRNKSDW
jgi:hypothetical protein